MARRFDNEQLRGAFAAGYAKGVRDGREALYREGWRKIGEDEELHGPEATASAVGILISMKRAARMCRPPSFCMSR
jgi:hypothetical protein